MFRKAIFLPAQLRMNIKAALYRGQTVQSREKQNRKLPKSQRRVCKQERKVSKVSNTRAEPRRSPLPLQNLQFSASKIETAKGKVPARANWHNAVGNQRPSPLTSWGYPLVLASQQSPRQLGLPRDIRSIAPDAPPQSIHRKPGLRSECPPSPPHRFPLPLGRFLPLSRRAAEQLPLRPSSNDLARPPLSGNEAFRPDRAHALS